MIVFLNGEWLPLREARVSIEDRGLLFADGVFETALLHQGRYFRLRHHLDRLRESAALLGLDAPQPDQLATVAERLAAENRLRDAALRIVLTRGNGAAPTLFATLQPPDPAWTERARRGWDVITARTRRPSPAAVPAQLKALGRTHALLARNEARAAAADDALLLTDDELVCEGPSWNVFWLDGNTLCTPALELGVLGGVTRTILLELAPRHGFTLAVGRFPRAALDTAVEVFATMTSVGIVSLRRLDGRPLPAATPAADRLRQAYWEVVAAETGGAE